MIETGLAVLGGIFYLTGLYGLALLSIVLAIVLSAGAALKAVLNSDWYFQQRAQAGLQRGLDILNPNKGIGSLVITKAIIIAVLAWLAWYIAGKAGYL